MTRGADDMPVWRVLGAMLTAFALAVQLLISGVAAGSMVRAADAADLGVICSHDPAAIDPANPPAAPDQGTHDLCPACVCAQSAHHAPTLPASPVLAVLRGRSEPLPIGLATVDAGHRCHSPYASRAPPVFA